MNRRTVLGGVALGLVPAAAGCGGGTGTGASARPEPTPTAAASDGSAATSESPAPGVSTETTGAASGDTHASFEPASGQQLDSGSAVVSAPADWPQNPLDDTTTALVGPTADFSVEMSQLTGLGPQTTPDDLVARAEKFGGFTDAVQRLDDVTIAGTPAYHLSGPDDIFTGSSVDEFGLTLGDQDVTVRVSTPKGLAQADRDSLVGTVLASFKVTDA